jgi:hypothetical protein
MRETLILPAQVWLQIGVGQMAKLLQIHLLLFTCFAKPPEQPKATVANITNVTMYTS